MPHALRQQAAEVRQILAAHASHVRGAVSSGDGAVDAREKRRAERLRAAGLDANRRGQVAVACRLLQQAAKLQPSVSGLLSVGNMRVRLGQPELAALVYRYVLDRSAAAASPAELAMAQRKQEECDAMLRARRPEKISRGKRTDNLARALPSDSAITRGLTDAAGVVTAAMPSGLATEVEETPTGTTTGTTAAGETIELETAAERETAAAVRGVTSIGGRRRGAQ